MTRDAVRRRARRPQITRDPWTARRSYVKAEQLLQIAQRLTSRHPGFFVKGKGPGRGNDATNAFMADLRRRAEKKFGPGHVERRICGTNDYSVDFYFEDEATIVEVALGLPNPHTEFERDVVKAALAKDAGFRVERLFFISKPGAYRKCQQPGRAAVAQWARKRHRIAVEIHELRPRGA